MSLAVRGIAVWGAGAALVGALVGASGVHAQAGAVSSGGPLVIVPGRFEARLEASDPTLPDDGGYYDEYRFHVSAGTNVTVSMRSDGFDGELLLRGPDGATLARDDTARDREVSVRVRSPGVYVVRASARDVGEDRHYVLHVELDGRAVSRRTVETYRIPMVNALNGIRRGCREDPSGASVKHYFYPPVIRTLAPRLCNELDDDEVSVLTGARTSRSFAVTANSPSVRRIREVHADPSQCVGFTAGGARVVGCDLAGAGWRLIDATGLDDGVVTRVVRGRLAIGDATVVGRITGFDESLVTTAVRERRDTIRLCYELELRLDGSVRGTVVVELTVDPGGRASSVRAVQNTTTNAQLALCVADVVARRVRLPRGSTRAPVTVSVPFAFMPER